MGRTVTDMQSRLSDYLSKLLNFVGGSELAWLAAKYWIDTGHKLLRLLCPNGVINAADDDDGNDNKNSRSRFLKVFI